MIPSDTIAAIATGQGGALGIIRISGNQAVPVISQIFKPHGSTPLALRKSSSAVYGIIFNGSNELDDVIVTIFRAPHSFTGEDSVEISCHNSTYILHTVLQLLIDKGCRLALPGEYTQRAFLNGKFDLCQAESVADLISSTTQASHRLALRQMRGHLSNELLGIKDQLLELATLMELELDFSDHEELEFADRSQLHHLSVSLQQRISRLLCSFQVGNAIKNGIPVAIAGHTNVGKSTLLNLLLHDDRAIVSDTAGTTRDTIEDTITIQGHAFRFIDTAGLRSTADHIEQLGISRSLKKISEAQIVLWVIDSTRYRETSQPSAIDPQLSSLTAPLVYIINKSDLLSDSQIDIIKSEMDEKKCRYLFVSAKTGQGLSQIESILTDSIAHIAEAENGVMLTNLRHYDALNHAQESLVRLLNGLETNIPIDLLAQDLHETIHYLDDIVGKVTSTDVLHNIFSHFCIGK